MTARLAVENVSKRFGGIEALRDVTFAIEPGEIHALLGENGAGKSTLVKIISGIHHADTGEIRLDGTPVHFRSPMEARRAGVVAVYQDPKLFPHLDVAQNIFMGIEPLDWLGTVDRRRLYERARHLLADLNSDLDPKTLVAGLSIGEIQFVEFARAMMEGVDRVLFLDEPTAALTPGETEKLFRIVRRMRDKGTSVVFISHRLEELEGLVDTVTVLRDGRHVTTAPAGSLDQSAVVRLMVGRPLEQLYPGKAAATARVPGAERLRVEGLGRAGSFDNVSFSLHAGEVVAMAGLVGAGRSEIAQAIFGVAPPDAGLVVIDGQEVAPKTPRQMLSHGLAYLPEDRDGEGLIPSISILRNLVMPIMGRLARFGVVAPARERAIARRYKDRLHIKATAIEQMVQTLSGGNRQKVVLAKWLATNPRVLILDEPTHGIDIGTKAQVHAIIRELADAGLAVLVISSDLPEVLRLGDRILVVSQGTVVATLNRSQASQEHVMMAASERRRRAAA